ncbi:TonB-dependent receptor [Sphingomonas sp. 2SG]|uniref:TonB-dependent receptor domain-containing protein n=1 Tax=Sphingomonas sp. 2SG TaxID=2502201 RepID=UPI0010F9E015|nr:TonB-dependent receptor [Sphingomonas sp. 2SG]
MRLKTTASLLALASSLGAIALPAAAQTVAQSDDTTVSQSDTDTVAESADDRAALISGKVARPAGNGNEIIVTGTRINRPNTFSAAPITSVTVQDIQAQAPLNVEEVLNRLPQIAPDSQQNYTDSDGRQRLKLRSLGFERTLVLIDGKRLGTQNGQDTNIIPASLLQRVDILSGGASSVYGSDAVSGVINFILRKDFSGLRIDTNYNFYNHLNRDTIVTPYAQAAGFNTPRGYSNDGGRGDITVTLGKAMLDERLKVSTFFNYRHADQVPYSARSSSPCQLTQTGLDGPLSCSPLSTYSPSGYVSPRSGTNSGTAYVNDPLGSRTFVPYGPGRGNAANPYDDYSYQRAGERYTVGTFASFEIAPEAELYGTMIAFRDTSQQTSPLRVYSYTVFGDTPYQVNCNNPFLSTSQAQALCGTAAGTAATVPLDVRYRFDGQVQGTTYLNNGLRATGGIRGKVGDAWSYDIGGVYARNYQNTAFSVYSDPDRVNRSLNVVNVSGTPTCASVVSGVDRACVPFDAFRASSGSPALTNYLFSGGSDGATFNVGTLYDIVASATGDLTKYGLKTPWADEGLAVSFATEFRQDKLVSGANQTYVSQYGSNDANLKQYVWESNVEAQLPLVEKRRFFDLLQVNGGARVSKYSSNPDKFVTWKIEGLYAPIPDFMFRSSFNKAQRAPTVVEVRQATNTSYDTTVVTDFCAPETRQLPGGGTTTQPLGSREACRASGLPDALYGSPTLICATQCTVKYGGFTADPETAYTLTYGLVVKPRFLKGLVFSADYYRIRINNSLGFNGPDYYAQGCVASNGDPFFCSGIVRNPGTGTLFSAAANNPTTGFFRAGTTNYYRSLSEGYDFQGQYTLELGGAGRLDWGFNGSLTTKAGGQDSPVRAAYNCAGYFSNGIACGQLIPKWSHGLRTTWTTADSVFNVSFNWRYISALTTANNSGQDVIGGTDRRFQTTFARIAPQSFFDLSMNFNVAKRFALRLIANNLLDRTAPIIPNSYTVGLSRNNTLPQRYDALGRQIAIGTTITF